MPRFVATLCDVTTNDTKYIYNFSLSREYRVFRFSRMFPAWLKRNLAEKKLIVCSEKKKETAKASANGMTVLLIENFIEWLAPLEPSNFCVSN